MFKLDSLNNPITSSLIGTIASKLTDGSSNGSISEVVSSLTQQSPASKDKGGLVESFFSAVGKNVDPSTVMDLFSAFVHDSKKQDTQALAAQANVPAASVLGFLNESLSKGGLDFNSGSFQSLISAINPMADDDHDGVSNLKESLTALFGKYANQ